MWRRQAAAAATLTACLLAARAPAAAAVPIANFLPAEFRANTRFDGGLVVNSTTLQVSGVVTICTAPYPPFVLSANFLSVDMLNIVKDLRCATQPPAVVPHGKG